MGSFWSKQREDKKPNKSGGGPSLKTNTNAKRKRGNLVESINLDLQIIGFRANRIAKISDSFVHTVEDLHHIEAIKKIWRYLLTKDENDELNKLKIKLTIVYETIGIKRSKAIFYEKIFSQIWKIGNYTIHQIVDLTIEYALGKYEPMRPKNIHFPLTYEDGVWFIPDRRRKMELTNMNVFHMNMGDELNKEKRKNTIASKILTIPNIKPNVMFLYHATNWASAMNIINRGPKHTRGGLCLDFGSLPGFYVTPTIETCIDRTEKHKMCWSNERAIIVFATPVDITNKKDLKNVIFDKPDQKWKRLTRDSRMCRENELDETDFVWGPMVSNANAVSRNGATPVTHNPPLIQLTGKSDRSDQIMLESMVAVFWIRK